MPHEQFSLSAKCFLAIISYSIFAIFQLRLYYPYTYNHAFSCVDMAPQTLTYNKYDLSKNRSNILILLSVFSHL